MLKMLKMLFWLKYYQNLLWRSHYPSYAIVEELAGFGAAVHTCSRNQQEIDQRLEEWKGKGYEVTASVCDISSKEEREELINKVSSVFDGRLNILINNAATALIKDATQYTLEDYASIMTTNVESPYHLTQLAHPLLKASGNASIVFISSLAGVTGLPSISVYAASKAAINQLTKNLACEWAKDNIRTNTVAPWGVRTTMLNTIEKLNAIIQDVVKEKEEEKERLNGIIAQLVMEKEKDKAEKEAMNERMANIEAMLKVRFQNV